MPKPSRRARIVARTPLGRITKAGKWAVSSLNKALQSAQNPKERVKIVDNLGALARYRPEAILPLERALGDKSRAVYRASLRSLREASPKNPKAFAALERALNHRNIAVGQWAVDSIYRLFTSHSYEPARQALIRAARNSKLNQTVRVRAKGTLDTMGGVAQVFGERGPTTAPGPASQFLKGTRAGKGRGRAKAA